MQNPPTSAKSWFSWASEKASSSSSISSENKSFFFDPSTRYILEQALSYRLDRFTGWDLSKTKSNKSFPKAASVFKRGVPFKSAIQENNNSSLSGSYPISISLPEISPSKALQQHCDRENIFIVVDSKLDEHWDLNPFKAHFLMDANEKNKSIDTVEELCQTAMKVEDHIHWIIIGGGITADTAAFAASIMGKSFTLVPTTLLAMADACVGGKTGVNAHPFGKNLIGTFAFPCRVIVIPQFLSSLSTRDLRSGGAECLKHAFLAGNREKAKKIAIALRNSDLRKLSEELEFVINLKAKIVAEDPTELGKRSILNLGHTLAHALEAISHKNQASVQHIHHGEAVAVGLVFCFLISKKLIPGSSTCINEMLACIIDSNLLPPKNQLEIHLGVSLEKDELWTEVSNFLLNDKKKSDGDQNTCNWIILKDWGEIYSHNPQDFSVRLKLSAVKQVWSKFVKEYPL